MSGMMGGMMGGPPAGAMMDEATMGAAPPMGLDVAMMAAAAAGNPDAGRMMQRHTPEPSESRRKLCAEIQADVDASKEKWKPDFDRMREWARMVRHGGSLDWADAKLYVANILQAHVATKVARLYARNPTLRVDRKPTLDFELWDGSMATLQAAAMNPLDPTSAPLIQDVMAGGQRRKMMDGLARTLQIVAKHEIQQVRPQFKQQMKSVVARSVVRGVAYVKLGFERHMQPSPETMERSSNLEVRLAHVERLLADINDPEAVAASPESKEAEELRLAIKNLQDQDLVVTDEGLRFDFPASTAIIPDRGLRDLRGFVGCDRVTEEFSWSVAQIQEMFGVDVRGAGTLYYKDGSVAPSALSPSEGGGEVPETRLVCVRCTYSRKDGLVYWTVKGYPDFLSEPAPPPVRLARFWPWFALMFAEVEDNDDDEKTSPFPLSDIDRLRAMQDEHNRSRQGLRDHRIAARPKAAVANGALDGEEDERKLTEADAHTLVKLKGLAPGQKIEEVLQWIKHPGIDPAMYDTAHLLSDVGRVTGFQAADGGGLSGVTATEVARAANSNDQNSESSVDDLNVFLSDLFQEAGRVLLMEMDPASVKKIAGPGAQWPAIPTPDVFDGLYLDIQGGSSGRPNRAADLSSLQIVAPLLMQIPGVSPTWLAKETIRRLDDSIDVEDAILEGLPAIVAMAKPQATPGGPEGPGEDEGPGGPSHGSAKTDGVAGGGDNGQGGAANSPAPPGGGTSPYSNLSPAAEPTTVVSGRGGIKAMSKPGGSGGGIGALFGG